MKILQICNKVPFPPQDGGCIAMNNLTQGLLNEGCEVKVLAINTHKHFVDVKDLPEIYKSKTNIEAVFIDTTVKPIPALLNLFGSGSYNISRFYSTEFEKKIVEILSSTTFDIIHLESLFVSMYIDTIRKHSKAKIVLRSHNIEYKLWERNSSVADNLLHRIYFKFLAKRLQKYELSVLNKYDGVAAITSEDANWFKQNNYKGSLCVMPFGIDQEQIKSKEGINKEARSVFHIGAMDWQPNIEGLNWFLNSVWDLVQRKDPNLKLYLAGRKMSDEIKKMNKQNVEVLGEVENAHDFMLSKGLMIAPLLSGGGMRVKLIEGMALGKVIVTTSIGAEGIECESGKNIYIANDATAFADAISKYVEAENHLEQIGKNAKAFVSEQYNNADICKRLIKFYEELK